MSEVIACPYCGELCERDWAPAPGGLDRTGPFGCNNCGAVEIYFDHAAVEFHPLERRTGWFLPNARDWRKKWIKEHCTEFTYRP